jgi:hypothetical protein
MAAAIVHDDPLPEGQAYKKEPNGIELLVKRATKDDWITGKPVPGPITATLYIPDDIGKPYQDSRYLFYGVKAYITDANKTSHKLGAQMAMTYELDETTNKNKCQFYFEIYDLSVHLPVHGSCTITVDAFPFKHMEGSIMEGYERNFISAKVKVDVKRQVDPAPAQRNCLTSTMRRLLN